MIAPIILPSHPVAILDLVHVIHIEESRSMVGVCDVKQVAIPRDTTGMHPNGFEARFCGRSRGLHQKDVTVLGRRYAGVDKGNARALLLVLLCIPRYQEEVILVVFTVARIGRRADALRKPALGVEQIVVLGRRPLVFVALAGHLMVDIGDDLVDADIGKSVIEMLNQAGCARLLQLDVLVCGNVVPLIRERALQGETGEAEYLQRSVHGDGRFGGCSVTTQ